MRMTRRGFILHAVPAQVALTGALAALFTATPVSVDLSQDPQSSEASGIKIKVDTAEAIVGRPATPRSAAGVARRRRRY